ncbi:tRNA-queuosine alpha-mannosyltransferase isoform X3 [Rhodnius prolixus]|uniref:tRNA-queuosine alpha-mannosyltransferase isoform X3 n=1 Tax=Rhodnius prolixus TaxID=13249 RepID=UPI003D18EC91
MSMPQVLLIEPFYGGSHKVLIDLIRTELEKIYTTQAVCFVSMTGKKWHWRARTSSLYFSEVIPKSHAFSLVADLIIFNSRYNCNSFLNNLKTHFRLQPDYRPRELKEKIAVKAEVLYFPVTIENLSPRKNYNSPVHIVWPHRWEHDKGVDEMVAVLFRLKKEKVNFRISMLGEQPSDLDNKYEDARVALGDHVLHWGFLQNESDYRAVLATAHLAISTAVHEFFGVAMMECVMSGCYPLCPDRLVYPELYPTQCLYGSQDELFAVIAKFASNMHQLQQQTLNLNINWSQYTVRNLLPKYVKCIMEI